MYRPYLGLLAGYVSGERGDRITRHWGSERANFRYLMTTEEKRVDLQLR